MSSEDVASTLACLNQTLKKLVVELHDLNVLAADLCLDERSHLYRNYQGTRG